MGTDKTYVFEGGGNSDALMASALNNRNGMFGGDGAWLWALLLLGLGRGGWGGLGGGAGEVAATYGAAERELLMQGIQGNRTAISELAAVLNSDMNSVQTALCGIDKSIAMLGGQVGMSTQQVINSIQAGNTQLLAQLQNCCCETRQLITQQGYENQLATLNQTQTLSSQADRNMAAVIAKVDAFEDRYRQDKFTALEAENLALKGRISQSEQNQFIYASINAAISPVNQKVNDIIADINSFKCKLPETVTLPTYPNNVGFWGVSGVNLGGCNGLGSGLGCNC